MTYGAAVVFTILAAVLFVLLVGFARPIAVLMQAPEEAVSLTTSYVRICGCGILFIVAYNLLSAVFRGLGDSRSPLLFVLVACLVNVAGDLILVAGLHLDAAGAAIATVLAQAVSVVCALVILFRKNLPFTITKRDVRLNEQCGRFLSIDLPLAYYMSMQPNASLTKIGLSAPVATVVGILLNIMFYIYLNRKNAEESRVR